MLEFCALSLHKRQKNWYFIKKHSYLVHKNSLELLQIVCLKDLKYFKNKSENIANF